MATADTTRRHRLSATVPHLGVATLPLRFAPSLQPQRPCRLPWSDVRGRRASTTMRSKTPSPETEAVVPSPSGGDYPRLHNQFRPRFLGKYWVETHLSVKPWKPNGTPSDPECADQMELGTFCW
ncbi:hypothetical protein EJB05_45670, partial [Eragrostis curvula]